HADRTDRLVERILDLVPRNRGIDGEVGMTAVAQLADGFHGRVEVTKHAQHTRRRRRVEDRGERVHELHACTALPRVGAGSTSFTSQIESGGTLLAYSRTHMEHR